MAPWKIIVLCLYIFKWTVLDFNIVKDKKISHSHIFNVNHNFMYDYWCPPFTLIFNLQNKLLYCGSSWVKNYPDRSGRSPSGWEDQRVCIAYAHMADYFLLKLRWLRYSPHATIDQSWINLRWFLILYLSKHTSYHTYRPIYFFSLFFNVVIIQLS